MAIVTIVGRPNVGKSSLFNRLVGRREAIVDDMPGVTRDRIYGQAEWRERAFLVVDTGGLIVNEQHPLMENMKKQVNLAVEESSLILLVIDGKEGATWMDEDLADLLRKAAKPVIVVVNKIDDPKHDDLAYDAYSLGFENIIGLSASHKRNIYDLMDMIIENLPLEEVVPEKAEEIRISIVGRPNVGKSSILNFLAGEERSIVSDLPGTTRDAVDTVITRDGFTFRIIDTAGLRRRSRIREDLEYYSMVRTLEAIERSDVSLLIMDGSEPVTDQDKKLAAQVMEKGKGLVIVLNKWDVLPKSPKLGDRVKELIRDEMIFVDHAPLVFSSALSGRGLHKLLPQVVTIWENRRKRISTNILNRMVRDILAFERVPSNGKGKFLKIFYCTQSGIEPPTFVFFVNDPDLVTVPFRNYMEKKLREIDDFHGSPLRIFWRPKG
ncbi:MAG: ribosome biogenesis GTPase Der [Synergistales bacterium]|nr:ribosome biogenesis GTPase Der [Synergistales bacterium]